MARWARALGGWRQRLAAAGLGVAVLAGACTPRTTERAAGDGPGPLPAELAANAFAKVAPNPFFAQYANSPIPWQPWGKATLEQAARTGRPVLLHIGYSTCPFSRQFRHSALDRPEVASFFRDHFVCLLADAESDLAANHVLLECLPRLGTVPAWPILVWMTPEGQAYQAHDFARKDGFLPERVLKSAERAWRVWNDDPTYVRLNAKELAETLDGATRVRPAEDGASPDHALAEACHVLLGYYDEGYGTVSPAQNFPRPTSLELLLALTDFFPADDFRSQRTREAALICLRKMSRGAIRDPLDGAFHRYSEKPNWNAPHSEKLASDQGLLAMTFLEAHRAGGGPELRDTAFALLDDLLSGWRRPDGLIGHATTAFDTKRPPDQQPPFLASFFTWSADELKRELPPEEWAVVAAVHGIRQRGNMPPSLFSKAFGDQSNVLATFEAPADAARGLGIDPAEAGKRLASAHGKLRALRSRRDGFFFDDRATLVANALAASALARAAALPAGERFADPARRLFAAIRHSFVGPDGVISAPVAWKTGQPAPTGHIDYAAFIQATLDLHALSPAAEDDLLPLARTLQATADARFFDEESGAYAAYGKDVWIGPGKPWVVIGDAALPADNAIAAANLRRLSAATGEPDYARRRARILRLALSRSTQIMTAHALLAELAREQTRPTETVSSAP